MEPTALSDVSRINFSSEMLCEPSFFPTFSSMDIECLQSNDDLSPFYSLLTPNTILKELKSKWTWYRAIDVLTKPLDVDKTVPRRKWKKNLVEEIYSVRVNSFFSYWCWSRHYKNGCRNRKNDQLSRRCSVYVRNGKQNGIGDSKLFSIFIGYITWIVYTGHGDDQSKKL